MMPQDAALPAERPLETLPGTGEVQIAPPTFLERWEVIFVAWIGGWILAVSTGVLVLYFWKRPVFPSLSGLTAEQIRETVDAYKLVENGWRDSVSYLFDLTVTKTALPIATLLLGYLFGRAKMNA